MNIEGYGVFKVDTETDMLAHRVAYELFKGRISDRKLVCHFCDNPSCVNPEHLWIGTKADNNKDKGLKGRGNKTSWNKGLHTGNQYTRRVR